MLNWLNGDPFLMEIHQLTENEAISPPGFISVMFGNTNLSLGKLK
jgi:hypothetical protein